MEKLQRRSDGIYETPTGLVAIVPVKRSGVRNGMAWFEFKARMLGAPTRVEWPESAPVIAVDADVARTMMANRYALNINDEQMDDYNAAIDAWLAAGGGAPQLRDDGPTVAEWVEKGYQASAYPPEGYASKSTPDEIAAAIEAQKPKPTPDAPVAPAVDPNAPPAVPTPASETPPVPAAPVTPEAEAKGKKGK